VFCSNSFATPVVITPNIYTPAQCPTSPPNLTHLEQKYWTYRGGVEYDLAPQSMLYATVSTGIHPGNINNASLATTYPQYVFSQPEKLTNYEIGSKNRFFDNQLQLNGSIFYLDYKNYQATFLPDPNIAVSATLNAARAESKGADFDIIYLLSANDRVNFSGQYLDTKFKTFVIPAFGINYSGETLASSPKWVLDAGYQHNFILASEARVVPRADVHYESAKKVGAFQPFPIDEQGGYATADATVSYESVSNWRVVGYVRNLTNKVYFTNVVVSGLVPQVRSTANISDPRTYGIRLEGSF
jgi:iron complex outermembrane receptor protein